MFALDIHAERIYRLNFELLHGHCTICIISENQQRPQSRPVGFCGLFGASLIAQEQISCLGKYGLTGKRIKQKST